MLRQTRLFRRRSMGVALACSGLVAALHANPRPCPPRLPCSRGSRGLGVVRPEPGARGRVGPENQRAPGYDAVTPGLPNATRAVPRDAAETAGPDAAARKRIAQLKRKISVLQVAATKARKTWAAASQGGAAAASPETAAKALADLKGTYKQLRTAVGELDSLRTTFGR